MAEGNFAGKTVLVMQADLDPGPAIARRFLAAGAQVILSGLDQNALQREAYGLPDPVRVEALESLAAEAFVALVGKIDRLDVWVNPLPAVPQEPAEALSPEQMAAAVQEGLLAPVFGAQAAGRKMLAQGYGVIANLLPVETYAPRRGCLANTLVGAGLAGLTQALGVEWAGRGVRVVGVAVPAFRQQDMPLELEDPAPVVVQRTPLKRLIRPEEIAEAVFFLAGSESTYVTAEVLRADGGWLAYNLF